MSGVRGAGGANAMYVDFQDTQVRVVSDHPLGAADAKALAARIERAWIHDTKVQRWDDQRPLQKQLTVAVLSAPDFARFTGDDTGSVAGVTTGKDLFVVPDRVVHATTREDEDTIAHELSHVQDFREAGDAMDSVPTYLEEGKASVIGDAWGGDAQRLASSARTMASLSADDVAYLLENFRSASAERRPPQFVYAGEVTGAMFVEFLATHVNKDAVAHLSDAVEAAGKGTRFTTAFTKAFGISLTEAEQRFVTFIRDTEGDPSRRLAGTLYAPR
jgi:hypothetical protein